jgi:hypothetical protein
MAWVFGQFTGAAEVLGAFFLSFFLESRAEQGYISINQLRRRFQKDYEIGVTSGGDS